MENYLLQSKYKMRPNHFLYSILLATFFLFSPPLFSQVYEIDTYNGQTINTCSGTFYDSGGNSGMYQDNENYTVTFCSSNGQQINLDFTTFNTESGYDYMYIYDGPTTGSPQITGSPFQGTPFVAWSSGTCLTVKFTSDGSVTYNGWAATITCGIYIPPPPPLGSSCTNPLIIDSLPYSNTGLSTCNMPDNYEANPCGATYMGGNDFVMQYTPDANQTATVILSNTDSYVGVFIFDACPNSGTVNCVEFNTNSGGNPEIEAVTFMAGQTYYIIVSTWPSPQCTNFNIYIGKPPPPPNDDPCTATVLVPGMACSYSEGSTASSSNSAVPDPGCANYNGQDVWFQTMVQGSGIARINTQAGGIADAGMAVYTGTCDSLTLIACDDSSGVAGMPMMIFTTIPAGTNIWIRIWENGGDVAGTFGICVIDNLGPPPCHSSALASDFCSTATPICDLSGYCGNTSINYTSSEVPSGFCGSIENNSWHTFVAHSDYVKFNVWTFNCTNGDGIQMEIYITNDCINFTSVSNCVSDGVMSDFELYSTTPLIIGNTYYLMIDGFAGDDCDYVLSLSGSYPNSYSWTYYIYLGETVDIHSAYSSNFGWGSVPYDSSLSGQEANQTIYVSPDISTVYYNKYSDSLCTIIDSIMVIVLPDTTVHANIISCELTFDIIPNPNTGDFYIKTEKAQNSEIVIFDALGGEVSRFRTDGSGQNISLPQLKPGIYTVKLLNDRGVGQKKIVVF